MIFSESDDIISTGDDTGDTQLVTDVWEEKHWIGHFQMYYQFRRFLRLWLPKVGLTPPREAKMEDLNCIKVSNSATNSNVLEIDTHRHSLAAFKNGQ